jgi:hypothetical protein
MCRNVEFWMRMRPWWPAFAKIAFAEVFEM